MQMFRNRLTKVYRHIGKQASRQGIRCYRIYDHDLSEFPICIEIYEDKLYVAEYKRRHGMTEEEHDEWMEQSISVISEVLTIPKDNIFLRLRQRKTGRLGQYQKLNDVQHEFIVHENGLKFFVNLSDYLDTGLFLDHRLTRQRVREECAHKKVLNLFAYTGAFSVYAAAGDASQVVTVDLSKTYLSWSEKNMRLNNFGNGNSFPGEREYTYIHADVLQYLKRISPGCFDLIIMDPPTFSNSKRMEDFLDIQRDHLELINDCLSALATGGVLYFSTNSRQFVLDSKKIKATAIKNITRATTPFDFDGKFSRWCYHITK